MAKIHLDTSKYPGDVEKRMQYLSRSGLEGVLTEEFFTKYTKCQNICDFLNSIGCDSFSPDIKDKLNAGIFDDIIQQQTGFCSWKALYEQAYQELLDRR